MKAKHERARVHSWKLEKDKVGTRQIVELVELQEKLKAWRHQAMVAVETPVVRAGVGPEDEALLEL